MNNVVFDPVTGQPVQKMQPQLDPMTGMPVQPIAAPMPNQAVYGKPQAMQTAENIFGTQDQRQFSVAMTKAQEDAFGPGSKVYESGNTEIFNALKNK
jgi:hypothetical protein